MGKRLSAIEVTFLRQWQQCISGGAKWPQGQSQSYKSWELFSAGQPRRLSLRDAQLKASLCS
jgi:hypothetical protein